MKTLENMRGVDFSLSYNPDYLTTPVWTRGNLPPGVTLEMNTTEAGTVEAQIVSPSGQWVAGEYAVAELEFYGKPGG